MLHEMRFSLTTDGSGDASQDGERPTRGRLIGVIVTNSSLAAGADITIQTSRHEGALTQLTLTDQGSTEGVYYPRHLVQDEAGGDLDVAGDVFREPPLFFGMPQVVVAQGGASNSVDVVLIYEEG